jgi:hypothetical protein
VIVDPALAGFWPAALAHTGLHGRHVGGVLLYDVPRALGSLSPPTRGSGGLPKLSRDRRGRKLPSSRR